MAGIIFFLFHALFAVVDPRRCYNNTASLHVYSTFHRYDRNNHSDFHIDIYKHVHILVYKHIHIDVYKHDHINVYKHDHHFM
ncbi:hypothetical protein WR25_22422 [Diploscapter pachys]|uniref:Secreted protein n=1 Tax=Diploscapter pachys TaxID=2018661 RepID=A0A2A2LUT0_9BILA|nr:hypothetical protein WR25_22422 [Diploscapter pachys]